MVESESDFVISYFNSSVNNINEDSSMLADDFVKLHHVIINTNDPFLITLQGT